MDAQLQSTQPASRHPPKKASRSCQCQPQPPGSLEKEVQLSNNASARIQEAPLCMPWLRACGQHRHLRPAGHRASHEVHLTGHYKHTHKVEEQRDGVRYEPNEDEVVAARMLAGIDKQQKTASPPPHSITYKSSAGLPTENKTSPALLGTQSKHGRLRRCMVFT